MKKGKHNRGRPSVLDLRYAGKFEAERKAYKEKLLARLAKSIKWGTP